MVNNRNRGWGPEDVRWHAWLATRGSDVVVTDANVHRYTRVHPPSPSPQPAPSAMAGREGLSASGAGAALRPRTRPTVPLPGLGAELGSYRWTQTVRWVELTILLPAPARARELLVSIEPTRVRVERIGETVVLESELARRVYVGHGADADCSFWELVEGQVVLHLSKWHSRERGNCRDASETWWPACLLGEPPCGLTAPPAEYYALTAD